MTPNPARTLLLLIALLAAGLASLWIDAQGHWRNLAWQAPGAVVPSITPPAALTLRSGTDQLAAYANVLERPLFAPDRRPPPPPAPPPPPDPLADIQIYGIFTGQSSGVLARVEGRMKRVFVNQKLGDWTLSQVDGRLATFVNADQKRELKLAYAPLGPTTPTQEAASQPAAAQPAQSRTTPIANAIANQIQQDEARERLRRRNEIRAARGLPLITQ